ncbi:MAG: hypothetical protein KGK30_05815, partial [Elusimicrobia bacterium]|nr:hypothetical protein [Elusimicrobiota bacterium]
LRRRLGHWPRAMELFSGTLSQALSDCAVVLSAGSGAAIEAACLGIPIGLVGRQAGLDYNPLEWFGDLAPVLRSPEEIAQRLRRSLALGEPEREALRQRGLELRRDCFEPVSPDSMRAFWSSHPAATA